MSNTCVKQQQKHSTTYTQQKREKKHLHPYHIHHVHTVYYNSNHTPDYTWSWEKTNHPARHPIQIIPVKKIRHVRVYHDGVQDHHRHRQMMMMMKMFYLC